MTVLRYVKDKPPTTPLEIESPSERVLTVHRFFVSLATSADVANRVLQVYIDKLRPDGLHDNLWIGRSANIAASKQLNLCYGPPIDNSDTTNFMTGNPESDANEITVYLGGPPIYLANGEKLVFNVDAAEAADTIYGLFEVDSPP